MEGKGPPAGNNPRRSGRYQLRPSLPTSRSFSASSSGPQGISPFPGSNDTPTAATPISNFSSTPTSNIPSTPSVLGPPANTPVVGTPGSGPLSHPFAPVPSTEAAMVDLPGPLSSSSVPPPSAEESAVITPGSDPLSGPFDLGSTTEEAMMDTPDSLPTPPAPLPITEEPIIGTPASDAMPDPFATSSTEEVPPMATQDTPAAPPYPPPFIEDPIVHNQETGPMFINFDPPPPGGPDINLDPLLGGIFVGHGPTLPGSAAFPVSGLPQPSETPFFDEAWQALFPNEPLPSQSVGFSPEPWPGSVTTTSTPSTVAPAPPTVDLAPLTLAPAPPVVSPEAPTVDPAPLTLAPSSPTLVAPSTMVPPPSTVSLTAPTMEPALTNSAPAPPTAAPALPRLKLTLPPLKPTLPLLAPAPPNPVTAPPDPAPSSPLTLPATVLLAFHRNAATGFRQCRDCRAFVPMQEYERSFYPDGPIQGHQKVCNPCWIIKREMTEENFLEHHRRGADEYLLPDTPGQHRCVKCGKTKAIDLFFRSVEGYQTRSDVWRTCNACWDGALEKAKKVAAVAIGIEAGQIPAPPTKKEELEKKGLRFCTTCKGTYPLKMFTRRDKVRRLSCNECAAKKSAAWRNSRERKMESEARRWRKTRGREKYDKEE